MTLEEMIDNIQEGQVAMAKLNREKWFVIKLKGELYDYSEDGEVLGFAMVSLKAVRAKWTLL
ncbi:hypothetical protein WKH57_01205 [Niallia taxi]|uniref:hypothetical protein n=1 Tax=Niallia taxi TaxID=2499688 RepID=UPI00316CBA85